MIKCTFHVPDDLHTRLTAQSAADRRSLNSELLHLLEVALTTVGADAELPGGDTAASAQ
ncbi:Arc family DNA-binding protein [Streptomyces sp. K1PN6]|uniref:Arc family DNA-binding protein n=1 Tax=Streptomyces acidicola TaxID=2596892 RepID=A0A5N8WJA2_9ACTN|nr:Arc family DNA-binding protein [Streptomyces acidicola]